MALAVCPECDEDIHIPGRPRVGYKVACHRCAAQLQVVDLEPLELDWALDDDELEGEEEDEVEDGEEDDTDDELSADDQDLDDDAIEDDESMEFLELDEALDGDTLDEEVA